MPERYKRCSTRLTRYVLSTALPLLAAAAQQRHTRRVLRFFWQCKFKPVGRLDRGLTPSTPTVLHVLHKNPYSVEVVPPRRRRREERRRVGLRVRLIGMEHGAELRILSVVGLRLFSSLPRDVRGRTY